MGKSGGRRIEMIGTPIAHVRTPDLLNGLFQRDGVLGELLVDGMQMSGLLLKLGRLPLENFFRPPFFSHVPRDTGNADQPSAGVPDRRHGQRDRHIGPILSAAHRFVLFDPFPSFQPFQDMRLFVQAIGRDDECNGFSDGLVRRKSQHVLRAAIPTGHHSSQRFADDRIVGTLHDGRKSRLSFLRRPQSLVKGRGSRQHHREGPHEGDPNRTII